METPERITCACGAEYGTSGSQKANHERGKQHRAFVEAHPPLPPPPDQTVYEKTLAEALRGASTDDIDAVELTPAQARERAQAREAGSLAPGDVGEAKIEDVLVLDERSERQSVKDAPPPWPEGSAPERFNPDGTPVPPVGSTGSGVAVRVVDGSEAARAARAQHARAFEVAASPMEQILGVNPGLTRYNYSFEDWPERDPDGRRFVFTRYYGTKRVIEDRFDFLGTRERYEIAGKVAAVRAHNERHPDHPIGYVALGAGVVRPPIDLIERAMAGEVIADVELPATHPGAGAVPGVVDVSVPRDEMREMMAPAPPRARVERRTT